MAFSPLFVGSVGATGLQDVLGGNVSRAFSPLFVGSVGATVIIILNILVYL